MSATSTDPVTREVLAGAAGCASVGEHADDAHDQAAPVRET